jgi:hypothetical protein
MLATMPNRWIHTHTIHTKEGRGTPVVKIKVCRVGTMLYQWNEWGGGVARWTLDAAGLLRYEGEPALRALGLDRAVLKNAKPGQPWKQEHRSRDLRVPVTPAEGATLDQWAAAERKPFAELARETLLPIARSRLGLPDED